MFNFSPLIDHSPAFPAFLALCHEFMYLFSSTIGVGNDLYLQHVANQARSIHQNSAATSSSDLEDDR